MFLSSVFVRSPSKNFRRLARGVFFLTQRGRGGSTGYPEGEGGITTLPPSDLIPWGHVTDKTVKINGSVSTRSHTAAVRPWRHSRAAPRRRGARDPPPSGSAGRHWPDPVVRAAAAAPIQFWSKSEMQALFLAHDGYLGALGALLSE